MNQTETPLKVFLLRPDQDAMHAAGIEWYDHSEIYGCVILARTESEARELAVVLEGDMAGPRPWFRDPALVRCELISLDGPPRAILTAEGTG